jgi:sulfur-carrier protein
MKLQVHYTAQMRASLGRGADPIELPDGSSLLELLDRLAEQLGHEAHAQFFSPGGEPRSGVLIVVNDSAVAFDRAAQTMLQSGDVVAFLPPISGG